MHRKGSGLARTRRQGRQDDQGVRACVQSIPEKHNFNYCDEMVLKI